MFSDAKISALHRTVDPAGVGQTNKTASPPPSSANSSVSEDCRRRQLELAVQLLQRQATQLAREGHPVTFTGRPVAQSEVRQLLLLSTWRSGSSYVGQLLASQPLAFYVFEPMQWAVSGGKNVKAQRRAQVLREVLSCDFSTIADTEALKFSVRSAVADTVCARLPEGCRSRALLEDMCAMHPVRVVKTVRARVRYLEDLVRASSRLTLVLLVRDPRAVVHSRRRQASWCRHKCSSVPLLCQWMSEALREAAHLERQLPGRVVTARYEQLTLDAAGGARGLFAALQVPLTRRTLQFLLQHTGQQQQQQQQGAADLPGQQGRLLPPPRNAAARRMEKERRNPYSTYRNSSAAAQDWRRTMRYQLVTSVQQQCSEVLPLMGHRTFKTQAELRNLDVPLDVMT